MAELNDVAKNVLATRYFIKDSEGKPAEDWTGLVNRVVSGVCGHENEVFKKKMFDLIYNTKFLPNSPCLVNAGNAVGGLMACQPGWVRVNTNIGLIRFDDLIKESVADIPTFYGSARITQRWSNGTKEVFRFETEKGYRLDCTPDHQVFVVKDYKNKRHLNKGSLLRNHTSWVKAEELKTGDALVLDFNEKAFSLDYVSKTIAGQSIIIDEDLALILAYAKCNGHLKYHDSGLKEYGNKNLVFEIIVDSEEALDLIRNSKHIDGREIEIENTSNLHLKRVRAYGQRYSYLLEFGNFDSVHCDIPDEIYRSPRSVIREFLRASFECEGTVSVSHKTEHQSCVISLGMISEEYIRGLQRLLNLFGIQASVYGPIIDKRADRHAMYYVSITNSVHVKKFYDSIGFISDRKQNMIGSYLETIVDKKCEKFAFEIKHIESLGEHPVYDISTTNETYLAEGVVVHNCFVTKSPEDSWLGMCENIANFGHVARRGGGCGVDFSNIRPSGSRVFGSTHYKACGPIHHMVIVSEAMNSITQAGFRGMACATYDTMVSTTDGFIPIGKIVEKNMTGLGIHTQFGKASITKAWCNGEKEVFEIITHRGNKLKLTGDHLVYAIPNYKGRKHANLGVWKKVSDLDIDKDALVLNLDEKPFSSKYQYINGIKLDENLAALISRAKCEGSVSKRELQFAIDPKESFEQSGSVGVAEKTKREILFLKEFGEYGIYHCDVPSCIFSSPKSVIASFLRVAFDLEATVDVGFNKCCITVGMNSVEFLESIQILLTMFGIESSLDRDVVHIDKDGITRQNMHYLSISNKLHVKKFMSEIGFTSKNMAVEDAIAGLQFGTEKKSKKIFHKIMSVTSLGEQTVYDISTTNETFLANSMVVHNCMGVLRVDHPDIMSFIVCKQREFALKYLLKEDFFNHYSKLKSKTHEHANVILDKFISNFNISVLATDKFMIAVENDDSFDLVFGGEIFKTIKAREIFDTIVNNAWKNGDPGLLFYDAINDGPYKYSGQELTATNPCGEQMLPQWGSCNLGSIDVSKFYDDSTSDVDWDSLKEAIQLSFQFLDNVLDANKFPTESFGEWAKKNRPVGLGIMGWADLLLKMKIPYGEAESLEKARQIGKFFADVSHKKSVELGKERGTPEACRFKELEFRRNVTTLSIAPTGSISLLAGCQSSIEPVFAPVTFRSDNTGHYTMPHEHSEEPYFRCALDKENNGKREVTWKQHIDMQAVFQSYVDSGISKTINLPNSATKEDVFDAYLYAWRSGCKGITVYRDGCKTTQVLSTNSSGGGSAYGSSHAKSRPKEIECDIFKTKAENVDWHIIVGLQDGQPYEIFAISGPYDLPENGRVLKKRKRHYSLLDTEGNVLVENLNEVEEKIDPRLGLETRRFSLELRHGIPPKFIVEQIGKSSDKITSFSKAVGRILRKNYVSGDEIINIAEEMYCEKCAKDNKKVEMIPDSGCVKCPQCFNSRCG